MPIILNQELYDEVKAEADKKYKKNSAYKSGWIVKTYKERGGEYKDDDKPKDLKRWFKEDWTDIGGQDYPVYRPTKRISKDTPLTADEIDPEQLKKQIVLKQQIQGNKNLPKFMKGTGLIVDDYTGQIALPYTQDLEVQLPPFLIRKNNKKVGYNYKLVNPLTKERNLSQRGKALNVNVARRIIPKPRLAVYEADFPQPNLRDFSPADRALLEKYDGLMDNYIDEFRGKDYRSIPEVGFKNETRGLPCKLTANCAKGGHKKGEKQFRGFDNIDGDDNRRIPIDEYNANKGKRGRPKKAKPTAPSVQPEEDEEEEIEIEPDTADKIIAETDVIKATLDRAKERGMFPKDYKKHNTTVLRRYNAIKEGLTVAERNRIKKRFQILKALEAELKDLPFETGEPEQDYGDMGDMGGQDEEDEPEEPKKRGRKKKYATAEEAKLAKKIGTLASNKRQKAKQKAEREQMGMEDRDVGGRGLAENNIISTNTKMPNKWVEHCKAFAKKMGISYSDALKHSGCKASYGKGMPCDNNEDTPVRKMGGASPYTTQPGKITTQNRQYVANYPKTGFGLDGGRQDDKLEAVKYNESQLGANAGKRFISL